MRRWKKRAAALMVTIFIVATAGFVSTGSSVVLAEEAEHEGEVVFAHAWGGGAEKEHIDMALALFEQRHPDIKLVVELIPRDAYRAKIAEVLPTTFAPDVFQWWAGPETNRFVDAGMVGPISDLWKEKEYDKIFPEGIKSVVTYEGEQYALPWGLHAVLVWYNKPMFNKIGLRPPDNYEEFLDICNKLKASDIVPLDLGIRIGYFSSFPFQFLSGAIGGAQLYRDLTHGKKSWKIPEVRKIFNLWKDWIDKGYYIENPSSYDWAEAIPIFARGEAAMYFMGTWIDAILTKDMGLKSGVDYDFFVFPKVNPMVKKMLSGPLDSFSMAKNAPHPGAAKILLDCLSSREAQEIRASQMGGMAPNVTVSPEIYNPLMQRVMGELRESDFVLNFDLEAHQVLVDAAVFKGFLSFFSNPDVDKLVNELEKARIEVVEEEKMRKME